MESLKYMLDNSGCIDVLEKLLNSQNDLISERAYGIVKDFIGLEDESEETIKILCPIESEFVFT